MTFSTLYAADARGKTKVWSIHVNHEDGMSNIVRTHGILNGKMTTSTKAITAGKNIGRANETTPAQQAINEAKSLYNKQIERGYRPTLPSEDSGKATRPLPMLAHDFSKRKHNIESSFVIQPKLDGVRMLCARGKDGNVTFYSRTGKEVSHLAHVALETSNIFEGLSYDFLDGEFYSHDMPFERMSGLFRKQKLSLDDKKDIKNIKYHIFDAFSVDSEDLFCERYSQLQAAFRRHKGLCHVTLVDTTFHEAPTPDCIVKESHDTFVQRGYEGAIIRNADSPYTHSHRSQHLQKYKEFTDSEYEIVDGVEATGNDEGTVIFVCKTQSGATFHVRPRGSRAIRRRWLSTIDWIKGKMLTVRYQELIHGVPRFGVGVAIRDYE